MNNRFTKLFFKFCKFIMPRVALLLIFFIWTPALIHAQNLEVQGKPNILYIGCDQFRYDCQGKVNAGVKTPNLDKLTADGMLFTRAFTPIPTCCPARQSLLSGKWPSQHKGLWNYDITLPVAFFEEHTWTADMRKAGYKQVYLGKWHVHPTKKPQDFGFDEYIADEKYADWRKSQRLPASIPAVEGNAWMGGRDMAPLEKTHTHWLANQAIAQLKKLKQAGNPWHLRIEFIEPHLPANPVAQFLDMYDPAAIKPWGNFPDRMKGKPYIQRQMLYNWGIEQYTWKEWAVYMQHYYAMISQTDDAIGMILKALKELELDDNTVVIFTSDHGDAAGSHGLIDKHYVMYDEEVRVPLVVKWPGVVKPGTQSDQIVINGLDLSATIPQMAGFTFMQGVGRSLIPLLEGEIPGDWRQYAFSDYNGQQFGLYVQRMIRNDQLKYIWNLTDVDELYDLQKDPWEMNNLIADPAYKNALRTLRHALYKDLEERKDPVVKWVGKTQLLEGKKQVLSQ
ncbi:MAG: sulfatase-like hydrolase/transferase [Chitinophagaceae bacterium]|nr:sulfatase-like hydrolase/transferase [Chitinophagaceae bacterium]